MRNSKKNALDAILLAGARILSMLIGIVSTSVLSHALSLEMYGTYTSANLIVSTATLVTILGLMDAANYFYSCGDKLQREYIATIFAIEIVIGLICAAFLWIGKPLVLKWFENPGINAVYGLIIFRPLLQNLGDMLLTLQVAIGKARNVAARNIIFSVLKMIAVILTAFYFKMLKTIFTSLLLLDVCTILFYYSSFKKVAFPIKLGQFSWKRLKDILKFCIPLGVYLLMASVLRDMDKYIVALFESTERFAIYSNCSTSLPFNVLSAAFLTVITPRITKMIHEKEHLRCRNLLKAYLKIGYITTVTFASFAIVMAREIILLLYGEHYVSGILVFVLYTVVEMMKFASMTLVLSAAGRTKTLMFISFGTVIANLILDMVLYQIIGFIGPAVATALISIIGAAIILSLSAHEIHCDLCQLFDLKEAGVFLFQLLLLLVLSSAAKTVLRETGVHYILVVGLLGVCLCGIIIILQKNNLAEAIKVINQGKMVTENQ